MNHCPCGSGMAYADCCAPYHLGHAAARRAETLMRSRYAAYALGLSDYLASTWHPSTRPDPLKLAGDDGPAWLKLEVLRSAGGGENDAEGLVEFKAHWQACEQRGCLHEASRFVQENGCWYYLDGEVFPPPAAVKTGRNEACPCGSGKKFKRCCGG